MGCQGEGHEFTTSTSVCLHVFSSCTSLKVIRLSVVFHEEQWKVLNSYYQFVLVSQSPSLPLTTRLVRTGHRCAAGTYQTGEVYHLAVVVGAPQQVVVDEGHGGEAPLTGGADRSLDGFTKLICKNKEMLAMPRHV